MARRRLAECLWRACTPVDDSRIRQVSGRSRLLEHYASGLGDDSGDGRPGLDLSRRATRRNELEFCPSRSGRGDDSVVGRQFAVWNLRPKDAGWTCLRRVAAAIGLMVWMEFSVMIVFLGAAWNAESAAQSD